MIPDKKTLYRLPWSLNDNPIAWLEITDVCDIHCPCCYRQNITGHKPLDQIKTEVLFLKRWRNPDNISIAGGEPLLHPHIIDIVAFIAEQGLKPIIITNAVSLTPDLLRNLKQAGVAGFTIHIDSRQFRPGWEGADETALNAVRQQYTDMLHAEGGLLAFFNSTVFADTLAQVPSIVSWGLSQIDKVHGLVFITFRHITPETASAASAAPDRLDTLGYVINASEERFLTSGDVYDCIKQHQPLYDVSSYLGGSVVHSSIKWLVGTMIGSRHTIFGSMTGKTMELVQTLHHLFTGRYASYFSSNRVGNRFFTAGLWDRAIRSAAFRRTKELLRRPWRLFNRIYMQSIVIVQAPDLLPDGSVDMCDSCPDTTVYNGRLVHSCRLDEYRLFGSLVSVARPLHTDTAPNNQPADE